MEDDAALVAQATQDPTGQKALERTTAFWDRLLARGTQIEVPEEKVGDTYKASLIYQFIGRDRGDVHAGEGFYDGLFLRDGAYQVWSLELAGYLAEARESLDYFLRQQTPEGQFVTQAGQLDAHGYALWALAEYYGITRDQDWLRKVFPQVRQAVEWLEQTRVRDGPFPGLLPAAVADGENLWAGRNHIVGYDFWSLRGLLGAVEMAQALGYGDEAARWARQSEDYRGAIDHGLKRTGTSWIPPSFEGDGTHWGNLECLFPTPLFDARDARVAATLEEVRRRFGGGFIEGTIRWSPDSTGAIHPYMSQFVTNDELVRGNQAAALEGFYSFLLHSTATHGFPEGVYYRTRTAWGDTAPHLWAAALYVITLRHLLVREFQSELHLSSAVPPHWLAPGKALRIAKAPTRFGPVSVTWQGEDKGVLLTLNTPRENPPAQVIIHLPPAFRIDSVTADVGRPLWRSETVIVSPQARRVQIRARRRTAESWIHFEKVVRRYQRFPGPWAWPLRGLVKLPLEPPLREEAGVLLDLAALATTDPFRAPFNVPNPGNYLFTGLQTGIQSAAGVPFRILDPNSNEGRGLVVLNGQEACSSLPSVTTIPVHRRARRVFFLGHVTGWSPGDPGVGEWGAVAEYVIRYADGATQTVPLVSGRTVDDWAMAPVASEAYPALRGDPWHLNVLGVELRDQEVTEIEFRDLGTPASPVLAAVTLVP